MCFLQNFGNCPLVTSMRATLQRPAPRSAWQARHAIVSVTPSCSPQRTEFQSKAPRRRAFTTRMPSPRSRALASTSDVGPTSISSQTRVLMVCLGNICRSPAAEAVLAHLIKKRKLENSVFVDSCGTVRFSFCLTRDLEVAADERNLKTKQRTHALFLSLLYKKKTGRRQRRLVQGRWLQLPRGRHGRLEDAVRRVQEGHRRDIEVAPAGPSGPGAF